MLEQCPFPDGYDLVVGTSGAIVILQTMRSVKAKAWTLQPRKLAALDRYACILFALLAHWLPILLPHLPRDTERGSRTPSCELDLGSFQHLLIVFGGPHGLEYALKNDELAGKHACPSELFDRSAFTRLMRKASCQCSDACLSCNAGT